MMIQCSEFVGVMGRPCPAALGLGLLSDGCLW